MSKAVYGTESHSAKAKVYDAPALKGAWANGLSKDAKIFPIVASKTGGLKAKHNGVAWAVVDKANARLFLVFQGSSTKNDWLQDVKSVAPKKMGGGGCKAGAGFLSQYKVG